MCACAAGDRCLPLEVEGVLHVARGVVGRHVERLEVVVVVLDLGAVVHLVAHRHEDVLELLAHGGQRMAAAAARRRRPGSVTSTRSRAKPRSLRSPARAPRAPPRAVPLDLALERVQLLAGLAPPASASRPSAFMRPRQRPRLATPRKRSRRPGARPRPRSPRVGAELPPAAREPGRDVFADGWTVSAMGSLRFGRGGAAGRRPARGSGASPAPPSPPARACRTRPRPAPRCRRATCCRGRCPRASGPHELAVADLVWRAPRR